MNNVVQRRDFIDREGFQSLLARVGSGDRDREPIVRQYLRVLLRWYKVILATVAGFVILSLIVTVLMTPKYTAIATLEIARESNRVVNIQGVQQEASTADLEFYQTQYGLLRSQKLAERVARQLRLADDPKFFDMFGLTPKGVVQTIGGKQRFMSAGRAERERAAGEVLLKNLTVSPIRLSRLVYLEFRSPDAELSARIVNSWATNFINSSLERRFEATAYARKFLENKLEQLRLRLEESERSLVNYATQQRIVTLPAGAGTPSSAERSVVADNLAGLNAALTRATADRIEAQSRLGSGSSDGASPEALTNDAIAALRQRRAELSADYQKLLVQFTPEYPTARALRQQIAQLDRSISREETRVASSIRNTYRDALDRENRLRTQVSVLQGDLLDLRRRSIQYNIYQREVDTNRQLYDALLQRYKEIGVAGGIGVNNISIVDTADVPIKPSSPRLLLNVALALVLGSVFGALLALALDQIDEALSNPEDVERALSRSVLGTVPRVGGTSPSEALRDRKSELTEAYLSVQANLRFATENGAPATISVTSTRPGEGKSTTALAVATMLARTGRRVVLIDGDMRSPSVHGLLELPNDRGVSAFLSGDDDLAGIQEVPDFGIWALTSGPMPLNAAELLTGDRLSVLLDRLRGSFDHIVIDSPPVMGLADAPLIGSRVEGVIFAVESHGIKASTVRIALGRLESLHIRVLGIVLTMFEQKRAHVGYGYDYGYGYGDSGQRRKARPS
jgi:polysaccharide biosynthesis transport protein